MRHILYVENNRASGKLIKKYFASFDHLNIQVAETAELGLEKVSNQAFDLVLMDIHLPGMDGVSLTKLLKKQQDSQHLPVIAVTADEDHRDDEENGNKLFDGYITKPVDFAVLNEQVRPFL